jgi:hypothetical protein
VGVAQPPDLEGGALMPLCHSLATWVTAQLSRIRKRRQAGALQNLAALCSLMYHRAIRKKNSNEDSHRQ